mmetsp:Transcript_20355/g.47577  ORF Transcript_20355/g.47577 Transcript_20355/m.47577 type:complete len:236 (-) Transcript_20355:263-970(-)
MGTVHRHVSTRLLFQKRVHNLGEVCNHTVRRSTFVSLHRKMAVLHVPRSKLSLAIVIAPPILCQIHNETDFSSQFLLLAKEALTCVLLAERCQVCKARMERCLQRDQTGPRNKSTKWLSFQPSMIKEVTPCKWNPQVVQKSQQGVTAGLVRLIQCKQLVGLSNISSLLVVQGELDCSGSWSQLGKELAHLRTFCSCQDHQTVGFQNQRLSDRRRHCTIIGLCFRQRGFKGRKLWS